MAPRLSVAAGLLVIAALASVAPQPGRVGLLVVALAAIVIAAGALWTAHRLDRDDSGDLTGRVLAASIFAAVALAAASRARLTLFSEDDTGLAFLLVSFGTGLVACGLFAWFVHGVHRRLRGDERPVFLWAAVGSLLASIPVQVAYLVPLLAYSAPLACLAGELLRGSSPSQRSPAEPL